MQSAPRPSGQQASVKIYNAVYSSVQVYECMVRGIAVMRRRADSFVNATQILKVAGVDKGRRTKILEKEILPGKHEIVQGGYGKYQGTWIPLERGRELAIQYGIGSLLSPLFDFTPSQQGMGGLPNSLPNFAGLNVPRPLSASASYPNISTSNSYSPALSPSQLGPAPIMPGSALRLLNQGRAQGLFTPSTSSLLARSGSAGNAGNNYYPGLLPGFHSSQPMPSGAPPPQPTLKRTRTDSELDSLRLASGQDVEESMPLASQSGSLADFATVDGSRPPTAASDSRINGGDEPSPTKRARTDPLQSGTELQLNSQIQAAIHSMNQPRTQTSTPQPQSNGSFHPDGTSPMLNDGRPANGAAFDSRAVRLSNKPPYPRNGDKIEPLKNSRRSAVMVAICQGDDASFVLNLIRDASVGLAPEQAVNQTIDWDVVIDDLGHSPLHLAASLARLKTVKALVANGADVFRGNYQGETPLIRSVLSTHNYDEQTFPALLEVLYPSIRTIDTAKRSVLHHAALTAGVKGRAPFARYYLEGVLSWIAQHEGADFRSIVDLQDEHGDTTLNVAARVGNRGLVRTLLDVGANRILSNKLGLRPGDFGVEPEELSAGPKAEDLVTALRSGPSVPVQKSQDAIADLTAMIQKLSTDFAAEIKSKQDAYDVTNAHVRAATRELAEQRKQIEHWKQRRGELDQVAQRVRNIEKALLAEDDLDWSIRTDATGNPITVDPNMSFAFRNAQPAVPPASNIDFSNEPPLPATNSLASLIKLRRMKVFQDRIKKVLEVRLQGLHGASAEKEYQCKKIVALCTGIAIDRVEDMLDDLLIAVESESQIIDIGRVSGFMQKVSEAR